MLLNYIGKDRILSHTPKLNCMNTHEIRRSENQPTDLHGVNCETSKIATSTAGICDFDILTGSFSFKPKETQLESEVKCFQPFKPGFQG